MPHFKALSQHLLGETEVKSWEECVHHVNQDVEKFNAGINVFIQEE
jgi:hypothetical protein